LFTTVRLTSSLKATKFQPYQTVTTKPTIEEEAWPKAWLSEAGDSGQFYDEPILVPGKGGYLSWKLGLLSAALRTDMDVCAPMKSTDIASFSGDLDVVPAVANLGIRAHHLKEVERRC
jgi:hypothetical protein